MKKFFKEFKEFISKGNVFDMAVGLIIATAFNKIVTSMVNDILMPLITWATGANSLADLSVTLKETIAEDGTITKLAWNYGNFLQTVIDFLIIAFSVFLMVKTVNASRKAIKSLEDNIVQETKKEILAEKKAVRKQAKEAGRPYKEVWAEHIAQKEAAAKELAEKKAQEEAEKKAQETVAPAQTNAQEDLLRQILLTLQQNNTQKSE